MSENLRMKHKNLQHQTHTCSAYITQSETDRQTDRQTDRKTFRQADRDRETKTERLTD